MIVGTRGSELARTQTLTVVRELERRLGCHVTIEIIVTQGDRVTDRPLRELEGRGYFTKELEQAIIEKKIDIAVHSYKDMPAKAPDGLVVAAVSARENPADILVIRPQADDHVATRRQAPVPMLRLLKPGSVVGTSAVRREAQILSLRPDLLTKDLRGNVPTRINKLREGQYDAIMLAAAGVKRLNLDLSEFWVVELPPQDFVPSPGQGALAIQMRSNDPRLSQVRAAVHDEDTATATTMERSVQARFGGGCGLPLGVYAHKEGSIWRLHGFWGAPGELPARATIEGEDWRLLAAELHAKLIPGAACVNAS